LFMAHAILTGLKAPTVVSDVAIPAQGDAQATRCAITNLKRDGKTISFDRLDEGLPMPVQPDWDSLLPYVNNLKDLNWYGVKAAGLPAGNYEISLDGVKLATHTADELAAGVNVGNVRVGPVYEQSMKVLQHINSKNGIVHQRFRGVILAAVPDWLADVAAERKPRILSERRQKIDAAQQEIHALAAPKPHRWEIKPAS
ncbi:MAG: hypothetical protein ACKVT0_05395, partial [Planctomycetaceae bacterium]